MALQANGARRMLIVGNWKMNGSQAINSQFLRALTAQWRQLEYTDAAICPAFVHLTQVAQALVDSPVKVGGQSLNPRPDGACTGEVSGNMLLDVGCHYVIVGHNERRRMQAESDLYVAEQFIAAQKNSLVPILCVGETEQAREAGRALEAIDQQLQAVIGTAGISAFENAVIAYEPIWAVGTGKTATPEQAQQMHTFIRTQLGAQGKSLAILYGGSVKPDNAARLFAQPDIDGALLGGASLNVNDFIAVCRSAEQATVDMPQ